MAILYKANGETRFVVPSDGDEFDFHELQAYVGGYIEHLSLPGGRHLIINENGKLDNLPYNHGATLEARGTIHPADCIVGDALVLDPDEMS